MTTYEKEWLAEELEVASKGELESEEEKQREKVKVKPTSQFIKMKCIGSNPNATVKVQKFEACKI